MIRQRAHGMLRSLGLEVHRLTGTPRSSVAEVQRQGVVPLQPRWPLPRGPGVTEDQIRRFAAGFEQWHYQLAFEGGPVLPSSWAKPGQPDPHAERPLQRFRHFMPFALAQLGGSLVGKRVLDIACNGGFWSVQCALLGAQVTAFDSRPEMVEQARGLCRLAGVAEPRLEVMNYWEMSPERLGGKFDLVLNLGILYHLPDPLAALRAALSVTGGVMVLDTFVHRSRAPLIRIQWEGTEAVFNASEAGIVAYPSRSSVAMMLAQLGATQVREVPLWQGPMPPDYEAGDRTSWVMRAG
jgi:tRNA (mo5U34)-methyltransferase